VLAFPRLWHVGPLPGQRQSLRVWHHREVPSVGRAQRGDALWTTWVGGRPRQTPPCTGMATTAGLVDQRRVRIGVRASSTDMVTLARAGGQQVVSSARGQSGHDACGTDLWGAGRVVRVGLGGGTRVVLPPTHARHSTPHERSHAAWSPRAAREGTVGEAR
jgi:hypothetical protein